jgi:type III pantothenate kinase
MKDTQQLSLLAVDIGNNTVKCGLLTDDPASVRPRVVSSRTLETAAPQFERLLEWLPDAPVNWCVAAVHRAAEQRLADWVRTHRHRDSYRVLTNECLPLEIHVDNPKGVGTDRLLAAVAVNSLRDGSLPSVIIDAGSAITVDLLSAGGSFQGGIILPGFRMAADALARDTDLLPQLQGQLVGDPPPVVGTNTESAIRSGLFWGTVVAVRELVSIITAELESEPQLYIAGGDAAKLAPFLSAQARVIPDLVFTGIAVAYRHLEALTEPPTVGRDLRDRRSSVRGS